MSSTVQKRSFLKLPVEVEMDRLLGDFASVPDDAWGVSHWDVHCSIDVLLLRGGRGNAPEDFTTDDVENTSVLDGMAYLPWLIGPDGPFGGSTYAFIFRTKPNGITKIHLDDHEAWERNVRVHIPLQTNPGAVLISEGRSKHFGFGQAWTFDNQVLHSVVNGPETRIHLIIDVPPNEVFSELMRSAEFDPGESDPDRWELTRDRSSAQGEPIAAVAVDQPLTILEKERLGLDPDGFAARIVEVTTAGRVSRVALEVGDIVVAADGVRANSTSRTALEYVRGVHSAGEVVTLEVLRDGRSVDVILRLKPEYFLSPKRRLARLVRGAKGSAETAPKGY